MKQTEKVFPYISVGIIFIILSVLSLTGVFIAPDIGFKMKLCTIVANFLVWVIYISTIIEIRINWNTETNMSLTEIKEYKSKNGYTGRIYGKSALSVYDENGVEVLHTYDRNIETLDELKELVEDIPNFLEMLKGTKWHNGK